MRRVKHHFLISKVTPAGMRYWSLLPSLAYKETSARRLRCRAPRRRGHGCPFSSLSARSRGLLRFQGTKSVLQPASICISVRCDRHVLSSGSDSGWIYSSVRPHAVLNLRCSSFHVLLYRPGLRVTWRENRRTLSHLA